MINSYVHNSSAVSTEDGSNSTVYGGPQPARTAARFQGQNASSSYHRQPLRDYFSNADVTPASNEIYHAASTSPHHAGAKNTHATTRQSATSPKPYTRGLSRSTSAIATTAEEHGRASPTSAAMRTHAIADSSNPPQPQQQQPGRALTEQSSALLEVVLPVSTKLPSQEARVRPLGVYVRTGRGGPNNVTRLVLVRLTDPADPFFLYELELLEDDYGAFKQRLELLVDFQGFPRYLVNMLREIADGVSPYELSFLLSASTATATATPADTACNRGTLRVLETTEFKTVEHISVVLLRQGDVGLKKYLAERFQFYERAFRDAEAGRAAITADLQEQLEELHGERDELRDALRKREEEMRFMTTDAEKEQLAALNRLRDQHTREVNSLRETYEKKLETHTRAVEEKTQQLRDTTTEKDAELTRLRARVAELEGTVATLQSQLRNAKDAGAIQSKELETLREMNDELANFKAEATKAMSENELNYVTLTERLRGTSTALQAREEKVAALQAHNERQDEYIRILADQNKQQADRVRELEKNLEKAHHIIANQLQTIKSAKDRFHIATDQLRSQEALLQERDGTLRRQQDELASANERVQELLRKNNDLRDQLEKTNTAREQLVQDVKQTQQALLRLQQSTSVNGRHWGVLSGGYRAGLGGGVAAGNSVMEDRYGMSSAVPTAGAASGVPADLMREFGANTHVTSSFSGYRSAGGGGGYVGPSAHTAASLFHKGAATSPSVSPSPAQGSQERAGSADTVGLTESQGRRSSSSLGKTEPSPVASGGSAAPSGMKTASVAGGVGGAAAATRSTPMSGGSSGSKGAGGVQRTRSSFNELAGKSFLSGDGAQTTVAAGGALQSAYF